MGGVSRYRLPRLFRPSWPRLPKPGNLLYAVRTEEDGVDIGEGQQHWGHRLLLGQGKQRVFRLRVQMGLQRSTRANHKRFQGFLVSLGVLWLLDGSYQEQSFILPGPGDEQEQVWSS